MTKPMLSKAMPDDEFLSAGEIAGARPAVVNGRTEEVSPKVAWPALAQLALGILLILLGFDVEGKTLVVSSVGTVVVGYKAKPGTVQERSVPVQRPEARRHRGSGRRRAPADK